MEILDAYIGGEDGKPVLSKGVYVGNQKAYEATQLIFATGNKSYKRSVLSKEVQELEMSGNIQICAGKNEYAVFDWKNGKMYRSVNLQDWEEVDHYFPPREPVFLAYAGDMYIMTIGDVIYYSLDAREWDSYDLYSAVGDTEQVVRDCQGVAVRFNSAGQPRRKWLLFYVYTVEKKGSAWTNKGDGRIMCCKLDYGYSSLREVDLDLSENINRMDEFASHDQVADNDYYRFTQCGEKSIMNRGASYTMLVYNPDRFKFDDYIAEIPYMNFPSNGAVFDGQYIYGMLSGKVVRTTLDGETSAIEVPFEDESDNNRYIGGISHDGEHVCVYVYETSDPRKHDLYHVADGKLRYIETMLQGVTGFSEGTLYCRKF